MNNKHTIVIMTASAIVLAAAGIFLTFIPGEILSYLNLEKSKPLQLLLQITGALYFAFAMLNWMTRTSIIGGIYNKPIALANFTHFFIGGLGLIKGLASNPGLPYGIWGIASIYIVFSFAFGVINFRNPLS